ncbi:MAG: transposase [Clostridia bacterium]|nr:transposase [Clostridia bacterium]
MPRLARKDLNTPFLHVMVQGVNKEYIFYSKEYIKEYLKIIERNIDKYNLTIMAYCVMSNHAHFLMYAEDIDELGKFMHMVNLLYAQFYNESENRCGVLFRNMYEKRFMDVENNDENFEKYVLEGIGEFCKVYSYSLVEIFSNRKILKQLINYLNENCMLRFVEIQRYLGISKMTLNNLRRV